jgi:hypothetical protein
VAKQRDGLGREMGVAKTEGWVAIVEEGMAYTRGSHCDVVYLG